MDKDIYKFQHIKTKLHFLTILRNTSLILMKQTLIKLILCQ